MENSEHDDYQSDKELKFYLRTFVFHSLPLLGMAGSIGGFVIEPEDKKYEGIYEGTKVRRDKFLGEIFIHGCLLIQDRQFCKLKRYLR